MINSVWAGLYLVYHYLNIMKNTSNISKETQQSYTSSYPVPTFIYVYSLALTGPSIFPYLKNPLLRSFAKMLIKCYFTGIITTMSRFCPISFACRIKYSEKNHQIKWNWNIWQQKWSNNLMSDFFFRWKDITY